MDGQVVDLPELAVVTEPLVAEQSLDDGHALLVPSTGLVHRHAESGEFVSLVPASEPGVETPTAERVGHGDLLGQVDGVVEGRNHARRADADAFGLRRDRARHQREVGEGAVCGEVVLSEPDLVEPELLRPTCLFEHVGEDFLVGQLRWLVAQDEDAESHVASPSDQWCSCPVSPCGDASRYCMIGHSTSICSIRRHRVPCPRRPIRRQSSVDTDRVERPCRGPGGDGASPRSQRLAGGHSGARRPVRRGHRRPSMDPWRCRTVAAGPFRRHHRTWVPHAVAGELLPPSDRPVRGLHDGGQLRRRTRCGSQHRFPSGRDSEPAPRSRRSPMWGGECR